MRLTAPPAVLQVTPPTTLAATPMVLLRRAVSWLMSLVFRVDTLLTALLATPVLELSSPRVETVA
jgi:hypothetical protein